MKLLLKDKTIWQRNWEIKRFKDQTAFEKKRAFDISKFDGNILLTEGATEMLKLLIGGTATAFNNANSFLGVGDSTTAESAAQTGLVATTNSLYVGMDTGFPVIGTGGDLNKVTFQSIFTANDANYSWQEFTLANGSSGSAINLNRKVSNQGTKVSGQIWTLSIQFALT